MYADGKSWFTVNNIDDNFKPVFFDDLVDKYQNDPIFGMANKTCAGNQECFFDSLAAYDVDFGLASKDAAEQFEEQESQLGMWQLS